MKILLREASDSADPNQPNIAKLSLDKNHGLVGSWFKLNFAVMGATTGLREFTHATAGLPARTHTPRGLGALPIYG